MATVSLLLLRRQLNRWVELVAMRGERLVVTRYGRPFVTLEPIPADGLLGSGQLAVSPQASDLNPEANSGENSQKTPRKRGFRAPEPSRRRPRPGKTPRKPRNIKDLR